MVSPTSSEKINSVSEPYTNASVFARVGLLVYTILIVYASWYPFSGWSDNGLSPWHYLSQPLPHYWTRFDVAANVLARRAYNYPSMGRALTPLDAPIEELSPMAMPRF